MTERNIELTRRKILASAGAIGVASAGAGLGTSAFFSDGENFANNRLVAGELDLKVDWEEHYSDWSDDEKEGVDISMEGSDLANPFGFPSAAPSDQETLYVEEGDVSTFMQNTAIEAFPDILSEEEAYDGLQATLDPDDQICDLPADLDGALSHPFRTRGTFGEAPNPQTTEEGDPLIDIEDIKPGDFGEVTLSFHICGNPGYVWLTGELLANDENTVTESEAEDEDENNEQTTDPISGDGELLNAIQTRLWYDDGDNVYESGEEAITPPLSLGELLLFLEGGTGIRLCSDGGGVVVEPPSTDGCPEEEDYDSLHETGDTVTINTPLTEGDVSYTIPQNPKCTDFGLLQAVKTDEAPEGPLSYPGTKTYDSPYGDIEVTTEVVDGDQTITSWSIDSADWCIAKVIVKGGNQGANVYSYDNDDGDDDFTNDDDVGAKSNTETELQTPTGQDISHVSFCVKPDTTDDGGDGEPQEDICCFENSTTNYIGFEWWLPMDVDNEIQSDSVSFDLGFYTEQCRHNDGSGMVGNDAPVGNNGPAL